MPETNPQSQAGGFTSTNQADTQKTLNNGEFLYRRCPCCGASETLKTESVSAELPAEQRSFDEIKQTWQHFFKKSSYFTYHRCSSCRQLYCPVFFHLSQLIQLYSRMSDNTANLPVEVVGRTQRRYFDILKKYNATSGTYLEFGPDIGLLTEACMQKGRFERALLIEPNLEVHKALRERTTPVPHQIFADMTAYRDIADHSIDTIAMIHVLDHLLDPTEILRTLKKKLRPGGKLLLVTHDESSVMAKILGPRWPAYCLQHPQLYNPKSISKCLENEGFKVLGVQKTYNYFPVTYLLRHLFWALKFGDVKLPNWYGLTIPLKLGNIATIAVA